MKKYFIVLNLLIASSAFAAKNQVEYDQTLEIQCAQEADQLGCAGTNDTTIIRCMETKKATLSPDCRALHDSRMKNL